MCNSEVDRYLLNYSDTLSLSRPELMNLSLALSLCLLKALAGSLPGSNLLGISHSLNVDSHIMSTETTDLKRCHDMYRRIFKKHKQV